MMTSADIRKSFLDFFTQKDHVIVPSAPIVVKNDPTLLFTNAGMNQFKEYFLGNKKPTVVRVADTQKCLRVSGKHNDLEEVGVDTYHHTMFEMLGNWSFGDYFKAKAIAWAWELLTEVYKLPKDRLYVTVFEGNQAESLQFDQEAFDQWKKLIAEDRILMGNKKDNFWEMGDAGPCGPCTEIHFDSRPDSERNAVDGKTLVNADHAQVIEIWNVVFIQFNRLKNGSLEPLPNRHVDTGMGFERLVRVIQGKSSNYDTDIFSGTIAQVEKISGVAYTNSENKQDVAFRVIADHIRAIAFTIADGQLPSNTGAGYVVRRILRRAVRYYYSYLNFNSPLLYQLLPGLTEQFQHVFPELLQQKDFITKVVKEEEEGFLRTISKGITRFTNYIQPGGETTSADAIVASNNGIKQNQISGSFAFELNDTYGFPIDLTELMAREQGWSVDIEGYQSALQEQKNRSRAATTLDAGDWVVVSNADNTAFKGYEVLETESKLTKYRKVTAKGKMLYQLVLDQTPFYAESGGQVGDKGVLIFGDETINVFDTKKENDLIIHFTDRLPENLEANVVARVEEAPRRFTEGHHTATHLLHAALRKVLGNHVSQKGSLVNHEHLRFDFAHFAKVTDVELQAIETLVNEQIRADMVVCTELLSKDEALAKGAMALFGEKYGDVVRVISMNDYSIELCGGTHAKRTGELGFFKIKQETAVAAGVRRIEAVSGKVAETFVNEQLAELSQVKTLLKNPKEVAKAVENLQQEISEWKKKMEGVEARQLAVVKDKLLEQVETIGDIAFVGQVVEVGNGESVKKLCLDLKPLLTNFVVVLAANIGGKAQVALMIDDAVTTSKNLDAVKIIKENVAGLIQGGGGGQKTLATAGGQQAGNLLQVIEKIKQLITTV